MPWRDPKEAAEFDDFYLDRIDGEAHWAHCSRCTYSGPYWHGYCPGCQRWCTATPIEKGRE